MRRSADRRRPAARLTAALALALALAGCSTFDNMFGEPSPARDSTGAHPMAKDQGGGAESGNGTAKTDEKTPESQQSSESSGGFFDRMFGSPSPPRDSTGAHPTASSKTVPGQDKPYPNIGTVPPRPATTPEAERQKMVQGLVADRADARYTDETLRRLEPHPEADSMPAATESATASRAATPAPAVQAPAAPPRAAPPAQSSLQPQQVPSSPPAPPAGYAQTPAVQSPPPPPPVTSMAPIPNPPLAGEAPEPAENPAAGTAAANFGAPPADIDIAQNQYASAGPAGDVDGASGSSFRVATVLFGAGGTKLDAADERELRRVVRLFRRQGGTVKVVGHASSFTRNMAPVRHQIVNFSLSLERAQAVARALERMGVPTDAIEVAALSDSQPVFYESMPAGEAANRRAEVFLRR